MISTKDILGPAEVRRLAGNVSRATLQRWQDTAGFPKPFKRLASTELWDAQEVRQWLRDTQDWRRKRSPRRRR